MEVEADVHSGEKIILEFIVETSFLFVEVEEMVCPWQKLQTIKLTDLIQKVDFTFYGSF